MSQHDEQPMSPDTHLTARDDAAGSVDILTSDAINARRQMIRQQQQAVFQRRQQLQQEAEQCTQNLIAMDGALQMTQLLLQDAGLTADDVKALDDEQK